MPFSERIVLDCLNTVDVVVRTPLRLIFSKMLAAVSVNSCVLQAEMKEIEMLTAQSLQGWD
jgi:hypothetical protein